MVLVMMGLNIGWLRTREKLSGYIYRESIDRVLLNHTKTWYMKYEFFILIVLSPFSLEREMYKLKRRLLFKMSFEIAGSFWFFF